MKAVIVKVRCITNLHAGSGDVNYNIIDNEVERDPITGYPAINSSGVKGALREYFKHTPASNSIKDIFGDDKKGNTTPGRVKIFSADFLFMPVRASAGTKPFYYVTTETAMDHYKEMFQLFLNKKADVENVDKASLQEKAEGEGVILTTAKLIDGKIVYVLSNDAFRKLSLPVIARNHLNNGQSENLWYEEFVPHESCFFFVAAADEKDEKVLDIFRNAVDGKIVQFGADASIGCGYCRLTVEQ